MTHNREGTFGIFNRWQDAGSPVLMKNGGFTVTFKDGRAIYLSPGTNHTDPKVRAMVPDAAMAFDMLNNYFEGVVETGGEELRTTVKLMGGGIEIMGATFAGRPVNPKSLDPSMLVDDITRALDGLTGGPRAAS